MKLLEMHKLMLFQILGDSLAIRDDKGFKFTLEYRKNLFADILCEQDSIERQENDIKEMFNETDTTQE